MTRTSPGALARQFKPLAEQLSKTTKPISDEGASSPTLRLAVLAGEVASVAAFVLYNDEEGQAESARHNLLIMRNLGEQLTATARAALAQFSGRLPRLHGHCLANVQIGEAEREWLELRPYA